LFAKVTAPNEACETITLDFHHDDIATLRAELRQRQRRLGTADEQPDDFECTRALAHRINNLLTVEHLAYELRVATPRQAVGW
jgi:hypothetical protein